MLPASAHWWEMLPFPHLIAGKVKTNYFVMFRGTKNDKLPEFEQMVFEIWIQIEEVFQWNSRVEINETL